MRRAQPDLPPALSIDRRKYVYDQYIASNGKLKVRCGSLFNAGAKKKLPGWRPVVKLIKTIAKLRGQPHAIDASLKQLLDQDLVCGKTDVRMDLSGPMGFSLDRDDEVGGPGLDTGQHSDANTEFVCKVRCPGRA